MKYAKKVYAKYISLTGRSNMTSVFNRKSDYIKSLSGEEINSLQKILKKHVSVCWF